VFQSRSGFSVRRDQPRSWPISQQITVSIPVWVFGPSRPLDLVDDRVS